MDSKRAAKLESRRDKSYRSRGQGLIEFALVLLLLLVIGIVLLDLGRAYFTVITLSNAAREGVRYLTLHPEDRGNAFAGTKNAALADCPDVDTNGRCDNGNPIYLNPNNVIVACQDNLPMGNPDGRCDSGSPARVEVIAQFRLIVPVMQWLRLPETLSLRRYTEMMVP